MIRSISPEHKQNWNWLLGFLQSSLNLLCLPSEHMQNICQPQKSITNCVFAERKRCIFLSRPLWAPEQIMLKLISTHGNVRAAFFNVSVQGLRARRMQKLNKQTLKSESVYSGAHTFKCKKIVLKLTRDNIWIAFLLKTLQCFSPSLIIPLKMFFSIT